MRTHGDSSRFTKMFLYKALFAALADHQRWTMKSMLVLGVISRYSFRTYRALSDFFWFLIFSCSSNCFLSLCDADIVFDCSQLPLLHPPLICIKSSPYWAWSRVKNELLKQRERVIKHQVGRQRERQLGRHGVPSSSRLITDIWRLGGPS